MMPLCIQAIAIDYSYDHKYTLLFRFHQDVSNNRSGFFPVPLMGKMSNTSPPNRLNFKNYGSSRTG